MCTSEDTGQCIEDDRSYVEVAVIAWVEDSDKCQDQQAKEDGKELATQTDESTEQSSILGKAEDIPVDELPSIIFCVCSCDG